MAAPVTVTADEIGRAGETLLAENRPVTGYSLRMRLGNRGDPKRLLAIWGEVRRGIAETRTSRPKPPLHRYRLILRLRRPRSASISRWKSAQPSPQPGRWRSGARRNGSAGRWLPRGR